MALCPVSHILIRLIRRRWPASYHYIWPSRETNCYSYWAKSAHLTGYNICKLNILYTTGPKGASQHILKCMWDCGKNYLNTWCIVTHCGEWKPSFYNHWPKANGFLLKFTVVQQHFLPNWFVNQNSDLITVCLLISTSTSALFGFSETNYVMIA